MSNRQVLQFKPWTNIRSDPGYIPPDSPYEKDVWDVRELGASGLNVAQQHSHYKLRFDNLSPVWLKEAIKKFIKYSLATVSFTTVGNRLDSMRHFSEFLGETYPTLRPQEMNRQVVLNYLTFLAQAKAKGGSSAALSHIISPRTRQARIYILRLFIDTCIRNRWLDFPGEPMVYPEDLPPRVRSNPRFIPSEVLEQLNQHLDDLPEP